MPRTRQLAAVLVVLWGGAVAYLGLTERRGVVGLGDDLAEPAQHFVSFAVMAALLLIVFPRRHWRIGAALAIAGIVGEFLQLATDDRQFDVIDIVMNLVGIAAGLGVVTLAGHATSAVLAVAVALLVAAPFVLLVDELPETSFPSNCVTPPVPVEGDPVLLIDGLSDTVDIEVADISTALLKQALVETSEFAVEAWFDTPDLKQTGPARVFTISNGTRQDEVNFHLGVDGSTLSIRFRTSCELFNWVQIEDVIEVGPPQHVVVNWAGGVLETWVDGAVVDRTELAWGDLTSWDTDFSVMVGDEVGGGRAFDGNVVSVAMWDRALDARVIAARTAQVP